MAIVESTRKLRGGYYTPRLVAEFLARWSIQHASATILEPSCGDGNLAIATAERLFALDRTPADVARQLTAVELDIEEAEKAAQRLRTLDVGSLTSPVIASDFFSYCQELLWGDTRFDAVIGNPPFIRYQHFDDRYRKLAFQIMRAAGLKPSNLTNIWVPFVVASTLLLRDTGRLAMVLPAELLQVGYTAELRRFLAVNFAAITIVTFRKLLFDGAQQEVVLLLASRKTAGRPGIDVVELDDDQQLATYDFRRHDLYDLKSIDHSTDKWTQYYLSEAEIQLLRRLKRDPACTHLGDVAAVDVGVVTGNNRYFVLSRDQAKMYGIQPYTIPLVGRTFQLPGIIYDARDLMRDQGTNARCTLFFPPNEDKGALAPAIQKYVQVGEEQAVHTGYKCRIRKRWYLVPSVWMPDAFLFRQINRYPRLVLNETAATATDTIHRVRFRRREDVRPTVAAFHNSMTFAFTEVMGRSYGGGVLELEPNEADALTLPPLNDAHVMLETLDRLARENPIGQILDMTDHIYLKSGMGLPDSEIAMLRGIWQKMSHRRRNRTFKRRAKMAEAQAEAADG